MRVSRISHARIMFHYGLNYARGDSEAVPDAVQGAEDALQGQSNPTPREGTPGGDTLEISLAARDLFEAGAALEENVTWEDSKRKIATLAGDDESYTYEQSHREIYGAGDRRISWEETQRNFYNANDEELAWEETHREEINLGDEILIKEQTRRIEPHTGKETIIWEQTRRKTVDLEDGTVAMERARRQFFNMGIEGQEPGEQQTMDFAQQQAATAYQHNVSMENAYRMNVEGYERNAQLISLVI